MSTNYKQLGMYLINIAVSCNLPFLVLGMVVSMVTGDVTVTMNDDPVVLIIWEVVPNELLLVANMDMDVIILYDVTPSVIVVLVDVDLGTTCIKIITDNTIMS